MDGLPRAASSSLVKYDEMCRAISAAYAIDEVADIRGKAMALQHYLRQQRNTGAGVRLRGRMGHRCGMDNAMVISSPAMKFGSLFSGIEAASVAWLPLGWRCAWVAEIDCFASAVLAHHYPDIPNLGDVNRVDTDAIEPVDLVVFGSPCQSFSVAGKRLGLDDPRGNMALVGLRVVGHIRPRWMVWENVPGVLSSDGGRDFGAFLGLLGELGYGFAYAILDAQHFGIPQRRRRVFVVGYLGDWRPAAAVLFEPESLRGDHPPRREAGQRIARPVAGCPEGDSGYRNDADTADNLIAHALRGKINMAHREGADTLVAFQHKASASQSMNPADVAILNVGQGAPAVAYGGNRQSGPLDVATAVNAHGGPHGRLDFESETFVTQPYNIIGGAQKSRNHAYPTETSGCLQHKGLAASGNEAGTLIGTGRGTPPVALNLRGREGGSQFEADAVASIRAASGGSSRSYVGGMFVRRLTPVECARLQGFPDDYLDIEYRGKPAADGNKYRVLGNSMAVPVMSWLGQRIQLFEDATRSLCKESDAA